MNLSAEQYLNLVDQMTSLKIQNQKYQKENSTLTNQIEKQRYRLEQLCSLNQHNTIARPNYTHIRSNQKENFVISKGLKTADDYVQQFKGSINSMQSNICKFITLSSSQQAKMLKDQINKIKEEIRAMNLQEMQKKIKNKQNASPSSEMFKQVNANSKNNSPQKGNGRKQRQMQQFFNRLKFIYTLWNKDRKQPSLDQLYSWIHKINLSTSNSKEQFNPIQAAKKARSQKRLLENSLNSRKVVNYEKKPTKNISKQKINQGQSNQILKTDRLQVQNMVKQYHKQLKNRQIQNDKQKDKDSRKTNEVEDQNQITILKSKEKAFQPYQPQLTKNKEKKTELAKRSILKYQSKQKINTKQHTKPQYQANSSEGHNKTKVKGQSSKKFKLGDSNSNSNIKNKKQINIQKSQQSIGNPKNKVIPKKQTLGQTQTSKQLNKKQKNKNQTKQKRPGSLKKTGQQKNDKDSIKQRKRSIIKQTKSNNHADRRQSKKQIEQNNKKGGTKIKIEQSHETKGTNKRIKGQAETILENLGKGAKKQSVGKRGSISKPK